MPHIACFHDVLTGDGDRGQADGTERGLVALHEAIFRAESSMGVVRATGALAPATGTTSNANV